MSQSVQYSDCNIAHLHDINSIQSHGALLGINAHSQVVSICSANVVEFLGLNPDQIIGKPLAQVFPNDCNELLTLASDENHIQVEEFKSLSDQPITAAGHRHGEYLFIEIERGKSTFPKWWDHASRVRFINGLKAANTTEECMEFLVDEIYKHTELDRVMCYRFLPDWHGEVTYEVCSPNVDGYLGLRFPASDIPANVRQLYVRNWHRLIADVNSPSVPLIALDGDRSSIDLTHSLLRAVHPTHIQYLRNMGVQSSFSLSIILEDELWAMIACHQCRSSSLRIRERLALEEMARVSSLHLSSLFKLTRQKNESVFRERLSHLLGVLFASGQDLTKGLVLNLSEIKKLFHMTGVLLSVDGNYHHEGLTLTDSQALASLNEWLTRLPKDRIHHFREVPESLAPHPEIRSNASGIIFIPIAQSDYLVFLRQEVVEEVNWAGKPISVDSSESASLTPRRSFEIWTEEVRNKAAPWLDAELSCADEFRTQLARQVKLRKLEKAALHDPLTGLANRSQFTKRFKEEVLNSVNHKSKFAVHLVDLDNFKPVNDELGHAAGDKLLQKVSLRLTQLVRSEDLVVRLGGDEFGIIQSAVNDNDAASLMAERIVTELAKPYDIDGHNVSISASVGVSIFPTDTSDEAELIRLADIALYAAKDAGRNGFSVFTPGMRHIDRRRS